MKILVVALYMLAYVSHSRGGSGVSDDESTIFERLLEYNNAWMLTKEAELEEKNNAWMLTKEAELKEEYNAWMLTKEAELKETIKEELKAYLLNKEVVDATMDPDMCPTSCLSLMEDIEMHVIMNSMSVGNIVLDIADLRSDVMDDVEKLSANDSKIETALQNEIEERSVIENKIQSEILDLHHDLDKIQEMPIGTIIAWTPRPQKDTSNPVELPSGWAPCDGSLITEGIWTGQATPDLNGSKRFLRGGPISEVLDMEEDATSAKDLAATTDSKTSHSLRVEDRWYDGVSCPSGEYYKDTSSGVRNNGGDPDSVCRAYRTPSGSISTTSTTSVTGSTETRPANMKISYIIRVHQLSI